MPFSGAAESSLLISILEELPLGIWVARVPRGEFVYANTAFATIMGMPPRDDVGAGDYTPAYHLEDRAGRPFPEERLPFVQAQRRRKTVVVDDIVIARADGSRVFVRAFGKPLFDGAGEIGHVIVAFADITAEVESEASAVVARHKLRTALDHAPIVLFANDLEGNVTVSEGQALEAMGFKSGELVGRSIFELYKDNPQVLENQRRAMAGETFRTVADLGSVVLESWMSPMRGPGGEIGGVIGVSTDVTERRRMERQVDRAERLAALGRLAASVAHEINNPLSYAIEALRLAVETVAAPPDAASDRARDDLLREAAEGMERVRLIARDLKAFSRLDEDARSPQDLGQALSAARKMVATRTSTRARVDLALGPPANVPAAPARLVQIFVNLILNAADALPAEGADRNRIVVSTRLDGPWAVVEVADNGPGVPADLRDRVFDPFFTTKPVGEGTGLGLFVTRNIVESFGGTIALDDAPGGGARFTLRLPTTTEPSPPPSMSRTGELPVPTRARVLVIDDEPQLARIFGATLAAEFDVKVFTTGRAGLGHLLESAPYDLVLCDLMMADVSGRQVFEELRRQRPGLEGRVVFMTGGVFDPRVAEFLASVPNECVDKPFDVRVEVRRLLKKAR